MVTNIKGIKDSRNSKEDNSFKMIDQRYTPYVAQRLEEWGKVRPQCPFFTLSLPYMLKEEETSQQLYFPTSTTEVLGTRPSTWCHFHQAQGQTI